MSMSCFEVHTAYEELRYNYYDIYESKCLMNYNKINILTRIVV